MESNKFIFSFKTAKSLEIFVSASIVEAMEDNGIVDMVVFLFVAFDRFECSADYSESM